MRRTTAILGSAIFLVIAPGTVAGFIPWWMTRWEFAPPLAGIAAFRLLGAAMIAAGLPVILDSFARFAIEGLGTPVIFLPPQHLVVTGWYRHVRNPMYVAIASLILGQGLLFGRVRVLEYGAVVWAIFYFFVRIYEEPHLRGNFGKEYEEYCANVPRWIPRLRPWAGPAAT